ncbi:hypothetical protein KKF84_00415 [Myxococcota bacterium]|nr:hypothetical protein [Myxococcota bacterium]MBU1533747.1 hypothetical protein [Myxococcota bacterium]
MMFRLHFYRHQPCLWWVLLLAALSCSTPKEKDISITPRHALKPVTYGRISQALITLLNIKDGGDMVERGGITMLAHAVSLFYGQPYEESEENEEAFLLAFCTKSFGKKVPGACAQAIFDDMTSQSEGILLQYEKLVSFRKDAEDLRTHILTSLLEGPHFTLSQAPTIRYGERRPEIPSSTRGVLLRRLPRGLAFIVEKDKVQAGDLFKASLDNIDAFTPLFLRAASFEDGQELSIIASKDQPLAPLLKIFSQARARGVSSLVLWGQKGGISAGLRITLQFEDKEKNLSPGIGGSTYKTFGELVGALAASKMPRTLLVEKPVLVEDKKIDPLIDSLIHPDNRLPGKLKAPGFPSPLDGGELLKLE